MTEEKKKPIGTFVFIVVIMLALVLIIGWAIPPMLIEHSNPAEEISHFDLYKQSSNIETAIWQSMTVHLVGMLGILLTFVGLARKMNLFS